MPTSGTGVQRSLPRGAADVLLRGVAAAVPIKAHHRLKRAGRGPPPPVLRSLSITVSERSAALPDAAKLPAIRWR